MNRIDWRSENVQRAVWLVTALIALALIVQGVFGANGLLTLRRKRQEYRSLCRQIQQLQKENAALDQQVHGLQSNPSTIAKYAREYLHMARPGEVIYVLPPHARAATLGASSAKPTTRPAPEK